MILKQWFLKQTRKKSTNHKIKNIGNDTLELTDFPELNKLSITTSGVFLINSTNELEITKSNKFMKMEPSLISSNKIELSFDYFDPKNEISFSIFHTGDIKVCGSIKNGKIINDTQIEKIIHYKTMLKEYIPIILLIICAIFYGINIYLNAK